MATVRYSPGDPIPGTQYRFVRLLGSGGHGEVYEVEHTFLEARAVMKLLHGHLVDREELAQRMMREARTLAKLRHPNLVEVRDGGITAEAPARPYFVMEALSGMSLRDLLRRVRRGVGVQATLRIATGMLAGLHHAHRAGVIHRDIKPDNVFLHRTSTDVTVPKVLDFGIAHLLLGRRVTGRSFLGTPRYAAPEQLRGEPPTHATDLYAVGLVLYELLTGEAPYASRRELGDLVRAHFHEPLPSPSSRGRDVPPSVDGLVALFCAKNAAERPPNAFAGAVMVRALRAQLEALEAGAVQSADFQTDPSPMDDALFIAAPGDEGLITELASSGEPPSWRGGRGETVVRPGPASLPHDTVPSAPPLFRTEPMAHAVPTEPVGPSGGAVSAEGLREERGGRSPVSLAAPPRVDRLAATRTSDRRECFPVPRYDTVVDVPLAIPEPTPPAVVVAARPGPPRLSDAPPSRAGAGAREPGCAAGPSLRRRVTVFGVALVVFVGTGVPLALRATRGAPGASTMAEAPASVVAIAPSATAEAGEHAPVKATRMPAPPASDQNGHPIELSASPVSSSSAGHATARKPGRARAPASASAPAVSPRPAPPRRTPGFDD